MRFSANLNIIIKAIEKSSNHISRDFVELENLQSNPASSAKFATSCYNRIKQILIDDFTKFRPEFNITCSDGHKVLNSNNQSYELLIHVVDGFDNLVRASADFTIAVALIHRNNNGNSEAVALAISKVIGGELFYAEKGFGAYLNNRRIRVSKRPKVNKKEGSSDYLVACDDLTTIKNLDFVPRNLGCRTLEIAYFSCARLEKIIFKKSNFYQPFVLLAKEAGGMVSEDGDKIIISNN